MPFQTLNLPQPILEAVRLAGYTEPTPIQSAAIPLILAGHDLVGVAQTGTGKTAAFVLPILARLSAEARAPGTSAPWPPRALILAPTRELAGQIADNVRAYGRTLSLRAATIYGGVSERPQIDALRKGVDLVVATPGRLLDLMGRPGLCHFSRLEFLVLDEADRMLDMGFLPDIRRIVKALPAKRQTLLFSATMSREIESVTREFLRSPKSVEIGRRSNPAATVTQSVYEVAKHLKTGLLVHLLGRPEMSTVLVFTRLKHGADRLARTLEGKGIQTATIHSNRSQGQRQRALRDFKDGSVRVLVATDIAARGIDVDGVTHVVNYDFPLRAEDYIHRIGRTGRAGAAGEAVSLVSPDERNYLRSVERFTGRVLARKRAESFNYTTPAPAVADARRPHAPAARSHHQPGPARADASPHRGQRDFRPARPSFRKAAVSAR